MDRFDRVFILNLKLLSWVGLGYNQSYRKRLIRYYVMGFMLLCYLLSQLCQLLTSDGDLLSVVPILHIFIITTSITVLYYTSIVHYMISWTVYSYMSKDWQGLKNDVELQAMQKHAYISKLFTLIIISMSFVGGIIYYFPSLLRIILSTNEVRRDMDHYPIISCLDYFLQLDRRTYYYPMAIYEIITSVVALTIASATFSWYFFIIQHICSQLSVIKYEIKRPFISNDYNDDLLETPINLSQWVIDIVQRLTRATEYMTLLNTAFENVYLIQMFLGFIVLILDFLCLFQIPVLLKDAKSREDVLLFILMILDTVFPLYINCYIGQRLIDYSVAVYKEACLVPIHNLSMKTQKLLLMMLMISSKPLAISIGKVYVSSHEFFSNLIQSSLSFAMVLRSMERI